MPPKKSRAAAESSAETASEVRAAAPSPGPPGPPGSPVASRLKQIETAKENCNQRTEPDGAHRVQRVSFGGVGSGEWRRRATAAKGKCWEVLLH